MEPLTIAVTLLGAVAKNAPMIGKSANAWLKPELGALPNVRADAVDILNAMRSPERDPWTAQSLFLFFAAFARAAPDARAPAGFTVTWTRPSSEVLSLLTRGAAEERRLAALPVLSTAMEEVPAMVAYLPASAIESDKKAAAVHQFRAKREEFEAFVGLTKLPKWGRRAVFAVLPLVPVVGPIAMLTMVTYKSIEVGASLQLRRDESLRITVLREIGKCLAIGGLSTVESRSVLLDQGLPEKDVMKALKLA